MLTEKRGEELELYLQTLNFMPVLNGLYVEFLDFFVQTLDFEVQQNFILSERKRGLYHTQETLEEVSIKSCFFPTLKYALDNHVITEQELIIINYALRMSTSLYPNKEKRKMFGCLSMENFFGVTFSTRDDVETQVIFGVLIFTGLLDRKEFSRFFLHPEKIPLLCHVFSTRECIVLMDRNLLSFKDMLSFKSLSELRTAIEACSEKISPATDSIRIQQ